MIQAEAGGTGQTTQVSLKILDFTLSVIGRHRRRLSIGQYNPIYILTFWHKEGSLLGRVEAGDQLKSIYGHPGKIWW